jgi:hypothetical protein
MTSLGTQEIIIPVGSKGFCVYCTYIIKIENNYKKNYYNAEGD